MYYKNMKNEHIGSSFEKYLEEDGIKEEVYSGATKKVLAYQIQEILDQKKISKISFAKQLETSHTSIDRLLDPDNDSVTLETLKKAAKVLGKELRLELV